MEDANVDSNVHPAEETGAQAELELSEDSNIQVTAMRESVEESEVSDNVQDAIEYESSENLINRHIEPVRAPRGILPPSSPLEHEQEKPAETNAHVLGDKSPLSEIEFLQIPTRSEKDKAKRQLSFDTGQDEAVDASTEMEGRLVSNSQAESASEKKPATTKKNIMEHLQRGKRSKADAQEGSAGAPGSGSSPTLKALKARAAARRESKGDITRPGTAPVQQRRRSSSSTSYEKESENDFERRLNLNLQSEVEKLSKRVKELSGDLESAQIEICNERDRHKETELSTKTHYESMLQSRQQEMLSLSSKIEELESKSPRRKILDEDIKQITLSESELEDIRREMQEQELLLKGYQSENENAVAKLKKMRNEVKDKEEKMIYEKANIARELAILQEQNKNDSQRTANWLHEKLELQKNVNELKEDLYQTKMKFKTDVDRLRREKQELEAKSAGVNLKQIEEEEALVKSLKAEMEKLKQEHAKAQSQLQVKLKWYAENQELVTENSDKIREQSDTISKLTQRLVAYEGSDHSGSPKTRMSAKIKRLEEENKKLQDLLAKNNPNSLAALIHASKPSVEESIAVKELQAQVEQSNKRNTELVAKHEAQLRALRQQHEKVRYQERERQQSSRAKELTKQLDEVRSHYSKKLRNLERQLYDARKVRAQKAAAPSTSTSKVRRHEACQTEDDSVEYQEHIAAELELAKKERDQLKLKLKELGEEHSKQPDALTKLQQQVNELMRHSQMNPNTFALQRDSFYQPSKENIPDMDIGSKMRYLGNNDSGYLRMSNKAQSAPEYHALEEKVALINARQLVQEEQWKAVINETKQLANLQQNVLNEKWRLAMKAKNAEIEHFRTELDAIMLDFSHINHKVK